MIQVRKPKYSFSKVNKYCLCGWSYYLTYVLGHYVYTDNIATEFGTLVHYMEEQIGNTIKAGKEIDYEKLKKDFYELNIPKVSKYDLKGDIFGINILKEKYKEKFFKPNELGQSYATKAQDYVTTGIYRLENWMKEHPDYEITGLEMNFMITFNDEVLTGSIDRVLHNKKDDSYIIEDIKSKDKLFKDEDLTTPLQFVIYELALKNILNKEDLNVSCVYDLPILNTKQDAGTPGFMKRGLDKLEKVFKGINEGDFEPHPSPLCAWCQFSPTNPEQPEAGKKLCPYYSLWKPGDKGIKVAHKWAGMEKHKAILEQEYELGIDFDF